MSFSLFSALLFWAVLGGGCSRAQKSPPPAPPKPMVIHLPASASPFRLLLPEGQNPGELPAQLEKVLGGKVEVASYADDAAAEKAVSEGACDLAALSDRAAAALIAKKALQPLPPVPGVPAPAPEFSHHYYDPAGTYTWPYGWSLLGWAAAPLPPAEMPRAWRDLARPGLSLSLPADPALRAALWALAEGKPPAEAGAPPPSWKEAKESADAAVRVDFLWKLRGHLKEKEQVFLPPGGSLIALYQWAVPASSKETERAAAALQFLAAPENAARIDQAWGVAATQASAHALFSPALQADPLLYPGLPERNLCRFVR